MIYLQLFWSFLQIGALSFGGGYAAMPLIQGQIVTQHGWLTMREFTDLVTIAEMTPGPIAVNAATFVGGRIAGITGSLAATLGCITPACLIIAVFDVETDLVLLEAGQLNCKAVSLGVVRLADIGLHQVLGVLAKQRAVRTKETIVVKKFIKHIFTIDAGYHNNSSNIF